MSLRAFALLTGWLLLSWCPSLRADPMPLSDAERSGLQNQLQSRLAAATRTIEMEPDGISGWSSRGDARFFLGNFDGAVADYSEMVDLSPALDASHWRRGIAYFYAGNYEEAAGQFERYHSYDNVDRENGIWRYLSQFKAYGRDRAREGLLKYEKDDRQPFPDVYRLFAGAITPEQILANIAAADIPDHERNKRFFYAHLYIGLNHAVEGDEAAARTHLAKAVSNSWPRRAGYGPNYMWHVARLHHDQLAAKSP
ncbi:Lipoprotein NlpI precursor [Maioricimonas rarisocia]|uniref:Lipoprotein NlpI n=1 Tax=Maioricimonas rarisocia TaxID=2528026 RepID=A0A517Z1L9_9PLAN|nr:tetratricopeptide repeat protein [Maioricimonas rarisocia]QDU36319.1 Lipoprotein NlpI precursor [Maioricimonas rarisocia]